MKLLTILPPPHRDASLLVVNPANDATSSKKRNHTGTSRPCTGYSSRISTGRIPLPKRRVVFAQERNEYYDARVAAGAEPQRAAAEGWYTTADFVRFQDEARATAAALHPSSWTTDWLRVYFRLRLDSSLHEAAAAAKVPNTLEGVPLTLPAAAVGLQDRQLLPIAADFGLRRTHLMQQFALIIRQWQQPCHDRHRPCRGAGMTNACSSCHNNHGNINNNNHAIMLLRETSLLASHAAVQYAQIVAEVLAQEEAAEHARQEEAKTSDKQRQKE